ncbi:LysR family transcriptional regulator [Variovorax sp. J31P179]|uniref:LysR family transcriptional regulator n=1 Tax=Variovorax sp. J31P179 TaxID=3053508 RepID=UPI002578E2AE|nr:LysR family transcriptional regulator [Variovorax sp. J31P179]MDM0084714.1 LysR family transcriptional regulator [Variovorax sp. J31P179]
MQLKQLEEFIAVVQAGSLRSAARKLGVTQPSLTKAIQRLEEDVGSPLFVRTGQGVSLTEFGSVLLPHAEAIQAELQRANEELGHLRGGAESFISASTTPVAGTTIVPEALRIYRRSYPNVTVSVLDGLSPPGLSLLRIGAVDFYVGSAPGVQNDKSLSSIQLMPNPLKIACRPGHPLQQARRLADLVGAEWAFAGPTGFRGELLDTAFKARGLPLPRSVTHCASFTSLLSVASASDILTLVAERMFSKGPFSNVLVPVNIEDFEMELSPVRVVWKASNRQTPEAKAFVTSLQQASRNS